MKIVTINSNSNKPQEYQFLFQAYESWLFPDASHTNPGTQVETLDKVVAAKALMKSKQTEQPLLESLLRAPDTDRNPVVNHQRSEHR